jgi:hypothetical protein
MQQKDLRRVTGAPRVARLVSLTALATYFCSFPAAADILYSNLAPTGDAYEAYVSGLDNAYLFTGGGGGFTGVAASFTAAGSGSEAVNQIDLGITNFEGLGTLFVSILKDESSAPGDRVAGALWEATTSAASTTCCDLVSITGISGVTLTGGDQYFLFVEPASLAEVSYNFWNFNNQGAGGDVQYYGSLGNGDYGWTDDGPRLSGAFDILSTPTPTPEPGSLPLVGGGLLAILGIARMRNSRPPECGPHSGGSYHRHL